MANYSDIKFAKTSAQEPMFRNIIINGDMSIAQRATSATGLTNGDNGLHTVDRWRFGESGAPTFQFTMSQDTDVPSGQGFVKSLKMDCTTAQGSLAAGDGVRIEQRFEGQNLQYLKKGTSNAESLTLSFWVKSNKTGTYIAEIFDNDNSRQISKSYTIDSASTWEKKTITYDGDTSGSLDNDNSHSLDVRIWLGAGSDFTSGTLNTSWNSVTAANRLVGQVNFADNTANEWYITGVQLEVGTSATNFEFLPYDVNLERCQRYYFEEGGNAQGFVAGAFNVSDSPFRYTFLKPMRTAPTGSIGGSVNTDLKLYSAGSDKTLNSVGFSAITIHGARVDIYAPGQFSTGQTGHFYLLNDTGKFKFDAEL